jgi:hypothetical protein
MAERSSGRRPEGAEPQWASRSFNNLGTAANVISLVEQNRFARRVAGRRYGYLNCGSGQAVNLNFGRDC